MLLFVLSLSSVCLKLLVILFASCCKYLVSFLELGGCG